MNATQKYMIIMSLLVGVLAGIIAFQFSSRIPRPEPLNRAVRAVISEATQVSGPPSRIVYRKSLIPGGISDAAALRTAVLRDPVLAAAFRDFDWNAAAPCVVPAGEFFVSYRLGDQIRWTTLPGSLADQGCITDGRQTVLTRCGNLISFVPQSPAGTETSGSLSMPEYQTIQSIATTPGTPEVSSVATELLPIVPITPSGNIPVLSVPTGIQIIPIGIIYPPTTTTPPTVQVPEPSISILIGIGLFFMICLRLVQARRISK